MSRPSLECPCGQVHELSAKTRVACENVTRGLPSAVLVVVNGQGWYVPRIYLAAHGLKGEDLPVLAARYGFAPG